MHLHIVVHLISPMTEDRTQRFLLNTPVTVLISMCGHKWIFYVNKIPELYTHKEDREIGKTYKRLDTYIDPQSTVLSDITGGGALDEHMNRRCTSYPRLKMK